MMTLEHFLKYEVDDFDADSTYIYLKLDKDKYDMPFMKTKSLLRLWLLLKFAPGEDKLEDLLVELKKNLKALELMAKDYCENMWCSACQHHTKCLEANYYEDLDGKDYLQLLYLKKAREEE